MIEIINSPTLKTWDGKQMVPSGGRVILTLEAETLVGADLSCQRLDWAYLPSADLRRADFSRASLSGANLSHAILSGANFAKTVLAMANLQGANFADAYLGNAWLLGAYLQGADLRFAVLEGAKLRFARYDETTLWPESFDPQEAGAKLPLQVKEWVL
jgi:uncharacterized protein YjbI with pentapeptide repeats